MTEILYNSDDVRQAIMKLFDAPTGGVAIVAFVVKPEKTVEWPKYEVEKIEDVLKIIMIKYPNRLKC